MFSTTALPLDGVATAVDTLRSVVGDGAVRDLTHDELGRLAVEIRRQQACLESVLMAAVAEVDARGSHVHDGALTTGAWLRMLTRVTGPEAATTVKTAKALLHGPLAATAEALAAGDIGPRHAQVIAAGVDGAPAGAVALIEPEALEVARTADVRAVSAVMKGFAHALDPDGADEAALRRLERRGLTMSPTLDGTSAIRGTADEVSAAVIAAALDAASPLVSGDTRSAAQKRLDALTDICRSFLGDPDTPGGNGNGRAQVVVTVDADTLTGDDPVGSPGATLGWVGPITAGTAGRVACDAAVTTVVIGPDGQVTATATQRRFFTPAQRRAIIARDGDRCMWPWCDRPVTWADAHHLNPWSRGGPTTIDNGALPCAGHHTLLHEGHWTATRLPDGRYQVTRRDGRTLGPEPHRPGHHRPAPQRPPPPRRE